MLYCMFYSAFHMSLTLSHQKIFYVCVSNPTHTDFNRWNPSQSSVTVEVATSGNRFGHATD